MSLTQQFIAKLEALGPGERGRLRSLAGQPLDQTLPGFDLFAGLWWPLRQKSQGAPRRETAWLVAKLFGAFPLPHVRTETAAQGPTLARVVGTREPRNDGFSAERFRKRFDTLLQTPLDGLEPHLRWALSVIHDAVIAGRARGLDWVQLLDDLSIWDRGEEHRRAMDVREDWAEQYLNDVNLQPERS
jgi:CRISPR type I-E-associated protein CasB/Cse2